MGWNWSLLSPWYHAAIYADNVLTAANRAASRGSTEAEKHYVDITARLIRYYSGERTLQLYKGLYSINLKRVKRMGI